MSRITKYICDVCEADIKETDIDKDKTVINASVYGVHLHTECFKSLTPLRLISVLGLDDITIGGEKLIYTKDFK
jgi:hypothetical protein